MGRSRESNRPTYMARRGFPRNRVFPAIPEVRFWTALTDQSRAFAGLAVRRESSLCVIGRESPVRGGAIMKRRAPVPTEQETDIGLCKPAISTASQSPEPLESREAPGFENVQRYVLVAILGRFAEFLSVPRRP